MSTIYIGIAGGFVRVVGATDVCRGQLSRDLGGFFDFCEQDAPTRNVVATVRFDIDRGWYDRLAAQGVTGPFRHISMHYPSQAAGRRFGRLASRADDEYVTHTTKGSNYRLRFSEKEIVVVNPDELAGAKDVRRVIRDQLLTFWMESIGGCVLHSASIVAEDGKATLVIGGSGSGKTSFFTSAASLPTCSPLATETAVVLPVEGGIRVYAIPEKINFLPGTLTQFQEIAHLAAHIPPSRHWRRDYKFAVRWQDILAAFGRDVTENGFELGRILYSRFGTEFRFEPVQGLAARSLLESEVITGGDPIIQNNWVGWFRRTEPLEPLLRRIANEIPSYAVEWASIADVRRALSIREPVATKAVTSVARAV